MKKILQMYSNMGDIARQIDNLEHKIKTGNFKAKAVGGAILKTEQDIRYMIDLQWARIRALEQAILTSEVDTKSYVKDLRDSMCTECIMNTQNPCEKDYSIMTLYKTLQEVIV